MVSDKGVAAVAVFAVATGANRNGLTEASGPHGTIGGASVAGSASGCGMHFTHAHEWGSNRIAGIRASNEIPVTGAAVAAGRHLAAVDRRPLGGMDRGPGCGVTLVTLVDAVRTWQARTRAANQGTSGRGVMTGGAQTRAVDITCGGKWRGHRPAGSGGKIGPGVMAGLAGAVGGISHLGAMVMTVAAKAVDVTGGAGIRTTFPDTKSDGVQGATGGRQGPANATAMTEGTGWGRAIAMDLGIDITLLGVWIG